MTSFRQENIQNSIKKGEIILGIDPGSRICGFACIQAKVEQPFQPKDFILLDLGVIELKAKTPFPIRLTQLSQVLHDLIRTLSPNYAAMETAFLGLNPYSALKLGELRGMFSAVFHSHAIPVKELAPNKVKKRIAGHGHASKELVCLTLKQHFSLHEENFPFDATDALAIALSSVLP